jgi:aspartate/glutamate racemase
LHNQRNNRNNVVEEVSDLLATDFLIVDAIARDAIALPANTVRNYDQQIADLLQVRADIEAAIQMLEQAIAFVENANAQQLSCMETLRHVSMQTLRWG